LQGSNGYGYGDTGRDKTDAIFARVLGTEDALVRHNFINGTHAISTALFGILRPNDTLISVTGKPYDTLHNVIFAESGGSLAEFGVKYKEIDVTSGSSLSDVSRIAPEAKAIYIQRSRGYTFRESLTAGEINRIIETAKQANPAVITITDNCYGELCEKTEPKADLLIGSLIKNLGGGIAETGGYIAGKSALTELCANRLTTVGIGKEAGCSLNQTRGILLGLFHAPAAVANALRTSVFTVALASALGYEAFPALTSPRTDLITLLKLGNSENLIKFCKAIQAKSPIDSHLTPEPWAMPGYCDEVIMAAGTFTAGASIEISADAPLREPYAVWLQGGLNFYMARAGVIEAVKNCSTALI
jgi:cystathionine beta-lyase family protein involved in aluminum resistance